ncbi:hypothetical protein BCT30_13715 [Enterovibrio norvegicus]|uniref:hypothetical protein n=1 Tax=Enterovibrio norvegicus TaxID=188144 RepID=UPI000C865F87|nr:hypothetical protein [Enterovibrio norvegicus]PMN52182.1 hypothetical protein BCT30_13715 [Enterovibrio norvegicus]
MKKKFHALILSLATFNVNANDLSYMEDIAHLHKAQFYMDAAVCLVLAEKTVIEGGMHTSRESEVYVGVDFKDQQSIRKEVLRVANAAKHLEKAKSHDESLSRDMLSGMLLSSIYDEAGELTEKYRKEGSDFSSIEGWFPSVAYSNNDCMNAAAKLYSFEKNYFSFEG